jgi:hypothetical protein
VTTLGEVGNAVEGLLMSIYGLNVTPHIPAQTDFPAAFWHPVPATDYRDGASDGQVHVFEIIVLVSASLNENMRTVLPFLERTGAQSIFAAFESNRGLGLDGVDAHVREARPLDLQEVAGYGGAGAAVTVAVILD